MIDSICFNEKEKYWGLDKGFFYYLVLCADDNGCSRKEKVKLLMDYVDKFRKRTYRHPGEKFVTESKEFKYGTSPEGHELFYRKRTTELRPPEYRYGNDCYGFGYRDSQTTDDLRKWGANDPQVMGMWGQWLRYAKKFEKSMGAFIAGPSA